MNRYDFVYIFDVKDANPNGDPDAGNLPRVDPETGHGLVTDVCLKRKVRNYVALTKKNAPGFRIYFQERAVLNDFHAEAWNKHPDPEVRATTERKKLPREVERVKPLIDFMCREFYDVRTFGAVMSTEVNCGQVRGPVQLSFARSVDPIVTLEHAITRSSVTNERDLEKERTMGRKFTVPYAVYVAQGFVNPFLAAQTGFSDSDLGLLWEALLSAFQFDQSAARPAGSLAARGLIVFQHNNELGCMPSHGLFERVSIVKKNPELPARKFSDYELGVDESGLTEKGVVVQRKC
jgi:CRISPR-associated protein Csd2